MKVLVLIETELYDDWDWDCSCYSVQAAYLVDDDVDRDALCKQWHEECGIPYKGKNQYGEWTSTKYAKHTKLFATWLAERFEKVPVIDING